MMMAIGRCVAILISLVLLPACGGSGGGGGGGGSPVLIITTTFLPGGTVGSAYNSSLTATNGTTPYTWSISAGSLPAGLTISSSNGTISGTPTTPGTINFTALVTDAASNADVQALAITIAPGPLTITTTTLAQGAVGLAYSATLAATGGVVPYTWLVTSGTLPSGVSLSPSGTFSGTPTTAGTSNFTVQVTDNASTTNTKALSITVNAGGSPGGSLVWTGISNPSSNVDFAQSIAIDSSGVYVGGFSNFQVDSVARIEKRALTDGSFVAAFGTNGAITISSNDQIAALATDGTSLFVVGTTYDPVNFVFNWRIEKRSVTDGALVAAFGSNGVLQFAPGSSSGELLDVIMDGTSFYLVGSDEQNPGDPQWRVEKRSKANGSLIAGFGTGGVLQRNPSAGNDTAYAAILDSSGLFVVGGNSAPGFFGQILKCDITTGAPIAGFGTSGVITMATGTDAHSIALDATGIYVGGNDVSAGAPRVEKRDLANGNLVPGFGTNGILGTGYITMRVHNDGNALYLAGVESVGSYRWRIQKHSPNDGSLITNFGTNGVVTSDPSVSADTARCVTSDSTHLYIGGEDGSLGNGNPQWHIEKRVK